MQLTIRFSLLYLFVILLVLAFFSNSSIAIAAPITFNTALPVAKGAFISREKFISRRFNKGDGPMNPDLEINGLVSVLGYGVSSKLALFAAIPYVDKSLVQSVGMQQFSRASRGFSDLKMFARYTFLQRDERSKTSRVAGFFGLKLPTGEDNKIDSVGRLPMPIQSGYGAWGSFAGVVATYQTLDYQIDAQFSFEQNNSANNFTLGRESRADFSFQYRLSPQEMSSNTDSFVYGVIEANLISKHNNHLSGFDDPNSGGTTLYLSPGIQYVTFKYIIEAAIQVPVMQNLHGNALSTEYIFTTGFRINF